MSKYALGLLLFGLLFNLSLQAQYQLDTRGQQDLNVVFDELATKFDLNFAYPSKLIQDISITTDGKEFANLDTFLSALLASTELEFIVENKDVLIRKRIVERDIKTLPTIIGAIIIDLNANTPLAHASIYLDDFSKGTFTDEQGIFKLAIESADMSKDIIVSYIGYQEIKIPVNQIRANSVFSLEEAMNDIDDVIIYHTKPMMISDLKSTSIKLSKDIIEANQANLVGGSDIFRIIQMLPGIDASDDSSADIKIRGSNADETMILLDDIPIYNGDHYYGIFSNINSAFVEDIELFKNVIPIEYIGGNAGLLRMQSNSDKEGTTGTVNLNLLNAFFNLSTDVSEKVSLNLGGRTTLANVNSFQFLDKDPSETALENLTRELSPRFLRTDPDFRFYDLNGSLKINLNPKSNLKLSTFYSKDDYQDEYVNDFETSVSGRPIRNQESLNFTQDWENRGAALSFQHTFNEQLSLHFTSHYSSFSQQSDINSTINLTPPPNNDFLNQSGDLITNNSLRDIGAKVFLEKNNTYKVGLSVNQYQTTFLFDDFSTEIQNDDLQSYQISLFGSYTFHIDKLNLNVGSRITSYQSNDSQFTFSPQILGTYKLDELNALKFSFGRNNQFLRQIQFENRFGQYVEIFSLANSENEDIPIGTSLNYMLGYCFKKADWCIDVELFYKDVSGVLEFSNELPGFNRPTTSNRYRLFQGKSFARGVDLMLTYNSKSYTSWVAYTLSKNENQVRQLFRNERYPNQNDRRHQFKWINQLQVKRWNFSANFFLTSGKPYLSYIEIGNDRGRENLELDGVYVELPYYGRIDIGTKYSFPLFNKEASLSLSIFNLTNRQNVKFIQQTYEVPLDNRNQAPINVALGNESGLLNRSIDLGFQFKF